MYFITFRELLSRITSSIAPGLLFLYTLNQTTPTQAFHASEPHPSIFSCFCNLYTFERRHTHTCRERGGLEREIKSPQELAHSPNACKSQGWAEAKVEVRNATQMSCSSGRNPPTGSILAASMNEQNTGFKTKTRTQTLYRTRTQT